MKPKRPGALTKTVICRVTPEEYEAVKREAYARQMVMARWLRTVVLQKLGMEPKQV